MKLYLNKNPRTFIVESESFVLVIRYPHPTYKLSNHHHHHHTHSSSTANDANSKYASSNKVIVEFVKKDFIDFTKFQDITPPKRLGKEIEGFLGFLNVKGNIYLGFITKNELIASPTENEKVHKITEVDFYCLNNDEYDTFIDEDDDFTRLQVLVNEFQKEKFEYPAASVRKFLSNGAFFYSKNFDITSNIQERGLKDDLNPEFNLISDSPYFKRFMWNSFMNLELIEFRNRLSTFERIQFDKSGFLITITRGYAQTVNTFTNGNEDTLITLISKQSCFKNGPLFGDWGVDDNGSVSNFMETEVIIYSKKYCFSYVIVRGNVPIYWNLESHFTKKNLISSKKSKKIKFPRSFEASQHAFERHFDRLASQFGEIHIINSLSQDPKTYKGELNKSFRDHIEYFNKSKTEEIGKKYEPESELMEESGKESSGYEDESGYDEELPSSGVTSKLLSKPKRKLSVKSTDLNKMDFANDNDKALKVSYKLLLTDVPIPTSTMKKIGYNTSNTCNIIPKIPDSIIEFGALFYDISNKKFTGKQLGVFRVNSFDNLSKANFISKIITQEVIELAFRDVGIQADHDLFLKHSKLWSNNDEYITKITNHFISNSTKLQASSAKSIKSTVKSNFTKKYLSGYVETKPNEMAMLKLLGRLQDQESVSLHNPIHDYVQRELNKRFKEFSSFRDISIYSSTFNVNGQCFDGDITEWIFPASHYKIEKSYDLVFIGFQEIVELTAGQMVNTNSGNLTIWEKKIKQCLNDKFQNVKYITHWSGQIGGMALILFVKEVEIKHISNIESAFKKTGLGGMSSNKGGIGVSFNYSNTNFCFVSSHLAAGLNNVDERHQNYKTIFKGIKFSKNRRIKDHDVVIWLGDFNYRINLTNEQVKPLIEADKFSKLFEYDQLNQQMTNGESFPFFDEFEIKFPPTYKFDNGTDIYDTSEKQRIPAWTDRILSKGKRSIVKQLVYDCCEDVLFSDHRPVYAIFKVSINVINEVVRRNLSNEIYQNYKDVFGGINYILNDNDLLFLIEEDLNVLPPPSSDHNKWWLDGGPVKINIPELVDGKVINPRLGPNPFSWGGLKEVVDRSEIVSMLSEHLSKQVLSEVLNT